MCQEVLTTSKIYHPLHFKTPDHSSVLQKSSSLPHEVSITTPGLDPTEHGDTFHKPDPGQFFKTLLQFKILPSKKLTFNIVPRKKVELFMGLHLQHFANPETGCYFSSIRPPQLKNCAWLYDSVWGNKYLLI